MKLILDEKRKALRPSNILLLSKLQITAVTDCS